jgi:hypothetical protein
MDDYKYFFNLGFFKNDNFDGYGEFLFKNGKKYEGFLVFFRLLNLF